MSFVYINHVMKLYGKGTELKLEIMVIPSFYHIDILPGFLFTTVILGVYTFVFLLSFFLFII
jgi:hypothetical protein